MLVGRDHERERLQIVLANSVQGEPGALVIRGDPGMGKTRLLSAAAENANDLRIIRVNGHEAETDIPYAALSMLLGPLIHGLPGLPDTQATALTSDIHVGLLIMSFRDVETRNGAPDLGQCGLSRSA